MCSVGQNSLGLFFRTIGNHDASRQADAANLAYDVDCWPSSTSVQLWHEPAYDYEG
jgi:hypothetical protein